MKIQISNCGHEKHEALLKRCIDERVSCTYEEGGMNITLDICQTLGAPEGYQISKTEKGWKINNVVRFKMSEIVMKNLKPHCEAVRKDASGNYTSSAAVSSVFSSFSSVSGSFSETGF